jgi:cation transport regulator ChaC
MLNPSVAIPLLVVIAGSVGVVFRFLQHRERMAELKSRTGQLGGGTERLERLEQAVEAIAIEMERVGEGQRYLTRVLENRPTPPR